MHANAHSLSCLPHHDALLILLCYGSQKRNGVLDIEEFTRMVVKLGIAPMVSLACALICDARCVLQRYQKLKCCLLLFPTQSGAKKEKKADI